MLGIMESRTILEQFFKECLNFWRKEGRGERMAYKLAIKDVEGLKKDPYSPNGMEIDEEVKQIFVKYKKMDLGI